MKKQNKSGKQGRGASSNKKRKDKNTVPVDREPSDSRLLSEDRAVQLFVRNLLWWVLSQLLFQIIVVDIVSDPDKLLVLVRASDQDHGHAYDIVMRNQLWLGCVGLQ